ncbi:hypothetical protein KSP40_PGU020799 [Platanthera guangdongensis]|uniref:Uncharacterized protein n=1 Tax=Platanthera guangdongensis TaxID=2320717 RepID=A0ABR2MZP4_9ASPA
MQPSAANISETYVTQETKGTSSDLIIVPSGGSSLILYDLPSCAKWVFGSILYLGKRILRIEDVLEKEVIGLGEMVKKVAEVTKKVSSDIAEALPADSSLKQLAAEVEGGAEVVYMDAEKTEAVIHKPWERTFRPGDLPHGKDGGGGGGNLLVWIFSCGEGRGAAT